MTLLNASCLRFNFVRNRTLPIEAGIFTLKQSIECRSSWLNTFLAQRLVSHDLSVSKETHLIKSMILGFCTWKCICFSNAVMRCQTLSFNKLAASFSQHTVECSSLYLFFFSSAAWFCVRQEFLLLFYFILFYFWSI